MRGSFLRFGSCGGGRGWDRGGNWNYSEKVPFRYGKREEVFAWEGTL